MLDVKKLNENIQKRSNTNKRGFEMNKKHMGSTPKMAFDYSDLQSQFNERNWADMHIQDVFDLINDIKDYESIILNDGQIIKPIKTTYSFPNDITIKLVYGEDADDDGDWGTDDINYIIKGPNFEYFINRYKSRWSICAFDNKLENRPITLQEMIELMYQLNVKPSTTF